MSTHDSVKISWPTYTLMAVKKYALFNANFVVLFAVASQQFGHCPPSPREFGLYLQPLFESTGKMLVAEKK